MGIFGTTQKRERSVLLCTVESGAVHATLCLIHPNSKPFIVHSVSKSIPFHERLIFDRFASATLQALADACQEITIKGIPHIASRHVRHGHIDSVHCAYGSPWYVSQTHHIDVVLPNESVVTKKTILDLLERNSAKTRLALADKHDRAKVLQQDIIDVRLNGYSVDNPYGKKADRISFSVTTGILSESLSLYMEDVVGRFFGYKQITHHAEPSILFFGIRDTLATDTSFLALDISAEVTDISLVRNGILSETLSFPFGVRTAIRQFSQKSRVIASEVLGIMQGLKNKKLDSTISKKYETYASYVRSAWKSSATQALIPTLEESPLPKTALLFGNSGEFTRIKDILLPTEIPHPTTGEVIPTTLVIAEQISHFCVVRAGVRLLNPLIPFFALYIHRFLTMKNNNSL